MLKKCGDNRIIIAVICIVLYTAIVALAITGRIRGVIESESSKSYNAGYKDGVTDTVVLHGLAGE